MTLIGGFGPLFTKIIKWLTSEVYTLIKWVPRNDTTLGHIGSPQMPENRKNSQF